VRSQAEPGNEKDLRSDDAFANRCKPLRRRRYSVSPPFSPTVTMTLTRPFARLAAATLLVAGGALLAGCARKTPDPAPTKDPVVTVTHPVARVVSDYEDFTGRTEPVRMVELKARVTGYLEGVYFRDGQDITIGKPLFDLDRRTYKAEFDRVTATLEKASQHHVTAKQAFDREKGLRDKGSGSTQEYDKALGELKEAEADINAAVAARESAAANLQFTRIAAPFDGRLSRRMVDPGNLVKADETALTTIVALDTLYATFDVDERTVMKFRDLIRKGEIKSSREEPRAVFIGTAEDEDEFPLSGLVAFTDNQIDANTGTLRVRAEVRNPKLSRPPWYMLSPGQFIRVRLPIGNPRRAVLVPEKALGVDQGQRYVYVVNEKNEVERRDVRLGPQFGTFRVVEDNVLKVSDRVVVDGLLRVRPGSKVDPKPAGASNLPDPTLAAPEPAPAPRAK
jgi:multidrug efflux system membrane fusion protein